MSSDQTARDLALVILELHEQHAPIEVIVGTVRRVLAAERERCAHVALALGWRTDITPAMRVASTTIAAAIRALP